MKIIDIKHKAFIEAKSPYVLWMDEQVPIGIYHSQSFIMCYDGEVTVEIPSDQTVFRLYIDDDSEDLNDHLTYKHTYSNESEYKQLIIVCYGEQEGDYMEDILINGTQHTLGCEIRGLNEFYEINLANFGVELPESITKAIYDGEINEENTDYVLLNNKYLELLQNYSNIIMNKGSYKSLFNSLKWFGYGDLVELREVWKHNTEDGIKYGDFDVNTILTDDFKKALSVYSKTTYMVLRADVASITLGGLSNFGTNENSQDNSKENNENSQDTNENSQDIDTLDLNNEEYLLNYLQTHKDEAIPIESLEVCKWIKEDMRVKMYLLGIYFEKFFCPIHLDIIRSCVEDTISYKIGVKFGCTSSII